MLGLNRGTFRQHKLFFANFFSHTAIVSHLKTINQLNQIKYQHPPISLNFEQSTLFRRSISELLSHRPVRRIPTQITTQIPSYLSSRKEFSVASQKNAPQGPGAMGKPSESGSNISEAVIGSVALGAAVITAYQTGYLDRFLVKEQRSALDAKVGTADKDLQGLMGNSQDSKDGEHLEDKIPLPTFQETNISSPRAETTQKENETSSDATRLDNLSKSKGDNDLQAKVASGLPPQEDISPVQESKLDSYAQSTGTSDNQSTNDVTTS